MRQVSSTQLDADYKQKALLLRLEEDVKQHFAHAEGRLKHSLGTAQCAVRLAQTYGVSSFSAQAASLLHDWGKVYSDSTLITRAEELDIQLGCDIALGVPLLHGLVAAQELPHIYPELPDEIWHAIAVHTTAEDILCDLDKVLYIADVIEPGRPSHPNIEAIRSMLGHVSLDELFCASLASSIAYVVQTQRFLYPPTLTTYNEYVQKLSPR